MSTRSRSASPVAHNKEGGILPVPAEQPSADGERLLSQQSFLRIGDHAPNFQIATQLGPHFDLYEYLGNSWGVLFSHPRDFTPVCTTELGRAAQLRDEWARRDVKIVALSVDSAASHGNWITDINEIVGCEVTFPVVADLERRIALLYGMLDRTALTDKGMPVTVRSVFVIDPTKTIRLIITYPHVVGRNFDEILRVIDALQTAQERPIATPADWRVGEDLIVAPFLTDEQASEIFPAGVRKIRPYFRTTPDFKHSQ